LRFHSRFVFAFRFVSSLTSSLRFHLLVSQQREVGTSAYSKAHYYAITIGVVYCGWFVVGVPITGIYIIYLNRAKMKHRTMRSAFGFLFEGYREGALYWEFAVLLRKVAILAVSLFWQDPFLQSVAALFVIMISIVVHMWFLPYKKAFLNNTELASLICLFTLSGVSLLLWYIQPRSDLVVLYEVSSRSMLGSHTLCRMKHSLLTPRPPLPHTHTFRLASLLTPDYHQLNHHCDVRFTWECACLQVCLPRTARAIECDCGCF
jgi:hypothetical protein